MEKNCLHCGTAFSTNRESKKYCTDKCKQMAYLTRNGLVRSKLSGLEEAKTLVNTVAAVSHANTMPAVNTVKDVKAAIDVNAADVKSVKDGSPTSADLEALLTRFAETIDKKIERAVTGIKQELAAVTQKLSGTLNAAEQLPIKPLCYNQPFESLIPKAVVIEDIQVEYEPEAEQQTPVPEWRQEYEAEDDEDFEEEQEDYDEQEDLMEHPETIAYMGYPEEEEQEEDNLLEEEKRKDYEHEKQNVKQKLSEAAIAAQAELNKQNSYIFIRSEFLKEVEKYDQLCQGGLMFRYPPAHWDKISINCVKWVNYRLRCLTECLLKLSNFTSIDRGSIKLLNKAFSKIIKSQSYQYLPPDYPYTNFIAELFAKLSTAIGTGYSNDINIKFAREKRAQLIAIRQHLVNCVPAIKFSELDFHEHPKLFVLPEKEEQKKTEQETIKKDEPEDTIKQAA